MYKYFKRSIDIIGALLVIILLLPLFIVIPLIIYLQDFHNALFIQDRVGRNGEIFSFYKFRSMPINTADIESRHKDMIQVTPFGRFLRRTNLDELPQLFNILKGEMSLIGPRPPIPSQINLIKLRKISGAISIKPGLTGWAQVNSYDNMPDYEKANLDAYYFNNLSFNLDVKIVLMTLRYLTRTPPAY